MEIWVHRNGQYAGRFSESAIREKVADGSLSAADLAWDETKSAWKPISEFLAAFPAAKPDPVPASASEAKELAATNGESKATAPRSTPPPLPSMPMPAAGPPPLPSFVTGPASTIPATTTIPAARSIASPAPIVAAVPPQGETIWSPVMAIIGSLFLSPAFGGFIVWRNWLIMKRRRRALMAAPWFWIGFIVLGLAFYSPNGLTLLIWIVYTVAWIAFSAFPQIRYVQTTVTREKTRWGLQWVGAIIHWGSGL